MEKIMLLTIILLILLPIQEILMMMTHDLSISSTLIANMFDFYGILNTQWDFHDIASKEHGKR